MNSVTQLIVAHLVVALLTELTFGYEIEGESDFKDLFGKKRKIR